MEKELVSELLITTKTWPFSSKWDNAMLLLAQNKNGFIIQNL